MKYFSLTISWISLLILPLTIISCNKEYMTGITGHGDVVSRTLELGDLKGFNNFTAANVYISQGEKQEVVIEGQENILDNLNLDIDESGLWKIKHNDWVWSNKPVKIYITIPSLEKLEISGSGKVRGETSFVGLDKLDLVVSGSGNIVLDLEGESIEPTVSGSGNIILSGKVKTVEARISGSGNLKAFDLLINRAKCRISGGGDAKLSVVEYLEASISGSGDVVYRGTPKVYVHGSGSGNLRQDR